MNDVYEQEYTNEKNYTLENILYLLTDNVKKIENEDYIFYNIYFRLTDDRKLNFEEDLNLKFKHLYKSIDFHYPDVIITENIDSVYYVGLDAYDKNIEYFTIRIEK